MFSILRRLVRHDETRNRDVTAVKGALKTIIGDTAMLYLARCIPEFQSGRYGAAMKHVDDGLAENPNHPKLLVFAGMIRFQEVRYKEAIDLFQKVLSIDPSNEMAGNMLGCKELQSYAQSSKA
jgi:tetratricopeptide (TPR) repeat protein